MIYDIWDTFWQYWQNTFFQYLNKNMVAWVGTIISLQIYSIVVGTLRQINSNSREVPHYFNWRYVRELTLMELLSSMTLSTTLMSMPEDALRLSKSNFLALQHNWSINVLCYHLCTIAQRWYEEGKNSKGVASTRIKSLFLSFTR